MDTVLGWVIPAVVVFGGTAVLAMLIGWAVRASRRSPRARASADRARTDAGAALVRLDDELGDFDIDVTLAGSMYGGDAPPVLRHAKMSAQHVRDQAFGSFAELDDPALVPVERERRAKDVLARVTKALAELDAARAQYARWTAEHRSAGDEVAAVRARLTAVQRQLGDPGALVASLRGRFDPSECADAEAAAARTQAALAEASARLDTAERGAADPTRNALPDLAAAERALRDAQDAARRLDQSAERLTAASDSVAAQFADARSAVRQAAALREQLEPDAAVRLGTAIARASAELDAVEPDSARRPMHAVDRIARIRDGLDLATGDARSAQQRLRGAQTALPGTLATAAAAVSRAEGVAATAGADARARLALAQRALGDAQRGTDAMTALDAARRAIRHAEDAEALANYDRLGRR
ncbi:hypothetical protein LK09_16760 [Microbacterium mangrovi]|uniref:Uncharacterized protein n=1 Tax=Microbacterium mangrovi TaxID=1348253 RepID=A0A0B1ZXQ7_9MICO|nr:hypothetical protein [Microbacterium mangrovi]KHK96010.1 hypothetical protein LK09_16760 [Microbacterium mangrovi]